MIFRLKGKVAGYIKDFSYTFVANIFSLFISAITVLIVPRYVDVEAFGYYQLYLFYVGYVGFSYFGWAEGVYLRLGGKYYQELDKPLHCTQFWLLGLMELIIFSLIFLPSFFLITDSGKIFVIGYTCLVGIGMCLRFYILSILQAVGRLKENAIVTISEKVLFAVFITILILSGKCGFQTLICADVFSKYISLGIGVWYCRNIVFSKLLAVRKTIGEIKANMSAGINVMVASMCSVLISGIARQGIEMRWGVSTFGQVSLTINISHMTVTAINAIAVVAYPTLRRMNPERWTNVYRMLQTILMCLAFGVQVFYYPLQRLLTAWLPQYAESFRYVAILLPVCVYESKMSILIKTYMNTLRLEKMLMRCNIAALIASVVCTAVSTLILNNITAAVLTILIVQIFRCILSEIVLSHHLPIHIKKDIFIEMLMTIAFIICNWYFGLVGMLIYAACYVIYIIIKRKDITESINFIKSMR